MNDAAPGPVGVPAPSPATYVAGFHEVYGLAARTVPGVDVPERAMRMALIEEEVGELRDALDRGDVAATADALADITYVVYGAALTFGIDLDAVIAEVHRSNLSKLGADGRPVLREDGKVLKGPAYTPPDVAGVLAGTASAAPDARAGAPGRP